MYYMGFTYGECYMLPIYKRRWFINRLNDEIKKSQGQNRGATANEPSNRALQGRGRSEVPAKLRRFT
jgi:hypothetical protein